MTSRENEAVAIEPLRGGWITLEGAAEQNCADFCCAEREAKVTGVALVHSVHGKTTGFVGGFLKKGVIHRQGNKNVVLMKSAADKRNSSKVAPPTEKATPYLVGGRHSRK
jgi:hypothetical protein